MSTNLKRLRIAAELVRDGRSLPVGDLLLSSEGKEILTVTGWTRSSSIENLSQRTALDELDEVRRIFHEMIEVCPELLQLTGKKRIKFGLGLDYGKGAIMICSEIDGRVFWESELKH